MNLFNDEHITLHKEAEEIVAQAELIGWIGGQVLPLDGYKYPTLNFWDSSGNHIAVRTSPEYIHQTIFSVFNNDNCFVTIKYNLPIVSPDKARQLIKLATTI